MTAVANASATYRGRDGSKAQIQGDVDQKQGMA
jgi:hypothetical protein